MSRLLEKPTNRKRRFRVAALIAGWMILGGVSPVLAQQAAPRHENVSSRPVQQITAQKQQAVEEDVLRRLQELEALAKQIQAETVRLRAKLSKGEGQERLEARSPGINLQPSATKAAANEAQATPSAGEATKEDEWGEPEVEKKQEARDDEARRRLTELETKMRKREAETAKLEEEESKKVKFEFTGKYKVTGNSRANLNLDSPIQKWEFDNASYVDHRFQIQTDAIYENFLFRLLLDKGNFVFDWKEDSEGTFERWGEFQSVNAELVRELFAQYTGDFVLRAGRQNWIVGNSISLEGPIDSIRLDYPLGKLPWGTTTLSGAYLSLAGGFKDYDQFNSTGDGTRDGNRSQVLGAQNKLDAYFMELDIRPSRKMRFRPYAFKVIDRGDAGEADLNLDKDFNVDTNVRDGSFQPLYTGLWASFEAGKTKLDAEAVYLSGSLTNTQDLSATALLLQGSYDFGNVESIGDVAVHLHFGRGSGDGTDGSASGTVNDFSGLFLCRDRHKYGNIYSEDIRAGYYLWDSNLSNITYMRLAATVEPIKNLKIMPAFAKIWTTEEVFEGRGPIRDWSEGTATSTNKTNDVGWEVDLDVTYPVLKNLDAFFTVGYFTPGAVYARPDGSTPDDAFEINIGAELKF